MPLLVSCLQDQLLIQLSYFQPISRLENSWRMVLYRGGLSFVVALIIGFILSYQFKDSQLRQEAHVHTMIMATAFSQK